MIRQVNSARRRGSVKIRRIWHKIFRAFTYMGFRGATCRVISGIDIALWDIRGQALGQPIYDLLGGAVRDKISLYCHPDQSKFTSKAEVEAEIRAIVESGRTALKFDPFPHLGVVDRENAGYLDGQMSKEGEKIAADLTAQIRGSRTKCGDFDRCPWPFSTLPTAIRLCRIGRRRADRLV
ncbi:MAG: hypothetical protein R2867_12375 [Caldilineaceae bacterium]